MAISFVPYRINLYKKSRSLRNGFSMISGVELCRPIDRRRHLYLFFEKIIEMGGFFKT